MKIVSKRVTDLKPDPKNARKHDSTNLEAIKKSLARFGQQKPIVINSAGQVVAGNGTLEAAQLLGLKTLDCVVTDLPKKQITAFAIADNRTAELSTWDRTQLAEIIETLDAEDFDATGFFKDGLIGCTPPDAVPDAADRDDAEMEQDEDAADLPHVDSEFIVSVQCENAAHKGILIRKLKKAGYTVI